MKNDLVEQMVVYAQAELIPDSRTIEGRIFWDRMAKIHKIQPLIIENIREEGRFLGKNQMNLMRGIQAYMVEVAFYNETGRSLIHDANFYDWSRNTNFHPELVPDIFTFIVENMRDYKETISPLDLIGNPYLTQEDFPEGFEFDYKPDPLSEAVETGKGACGTFVALHALIGTEFYPILENFSSSSPEQEALKKLGNYTRQVLSLPGIDINDPKDVDHDDVFGVGIMGALTLMRQQIVTIENLKHVFGSQNPTSPLK